MLSNLYLPMQSNNTLDMPDTSVIQVWDDDSTRQLASI